MFEYRLHDDSGPSITDLVCSDGKVELAAVSHTVEIARLCLSKNAEMQTMVPVPSRLD